MYFNFNEIKSNAMQRIESYAIENDGIIFGGAVRDMLIAESFAKKYNMHLREKKERYNNKKFWDTRNHPETAARTLIPRDLDIYFECKQNADKFIQFLHRMCHDEHTDIRVENTDEDPSDVERNYGRMLNVQKLTLTMQVGNIPFMRSGFNIEVEIDIVSPCYHIMMQPPFNNLDFLCNGFIKTKYGIMYSRDTGTYLDMLSEFERAAEIVKIQQDMLQFKTHFCRFEKINSRHMGTFSKNSYALKRISKLLSKQVIPWTICNLPFEMATATIADCDMECCICYDKFVAKDAFTYIPITTTDGEKIKSSITHQTCMITYLTRQQEEANKNMLQKKDEFIFICPFRHRIDFTRCLCKYKN